MNFVLSDEQRMISEVASAFFEERATSVRTRAAAESPRRLDFDLWRGFAQDLGLAGMQMPAHFGGAGLGHVELAVVAEAAGRHVAALPLLATVALAAPALLAGGSDTQQQTWLPAIAAGEAVGTLGTRGLGNDVQPSDLLFAQGRVSGEMCLVVHGAAADFFLVAAADNLLLIRRDQPSVLVEPLVSLDVTRPYARVLFQNTPAERLADGAAALDAALATGWIAIAADALGGAQACLDRTVAFAMVREQFGRPIGSFQAVKHRLADMLVNIEQARSAVYWAACAQDEADPSRALAIHSAKAFAADAYQLCAAEMIQLHGGIGFTWEHDAHLFFRRARSNASFLGSSAWHREQVATLMGLDEEA